MDLFIICWVMWELFFLFTCTEQTNISDKNWPESHAHAKWYSWQKFCVFFLHWRRIHCLPELALPSGQRIFETWLIGDIDAFCWSWNTLFRVKGGTHFGKNNSNKLKSDEHGLIGSEAHFNPSASAERERNKKFHELRFECGKKRPIYKSSWTKSYMELATEKPTCRFFGIFWKQKGRMKEQTFVI